MAQKSIAKIDKVHKYIFDHFQLLNHLSTYIYIYKIKNIWHLPESTFCNKFEKYVSLSYFLFAAFFLHNKVLAVWDLYIVYIIIITNTFNIYF